MNKILKTLNVLAMLSIGSFALAYDWGFTNFTDKTLVVKLKLAGTGDNFFNIVGPGQKTRFDWKYPNARSGFCLEYLAIGEYDESIAANFPGTNSPKLPGASVGGGVLDTKAITKAIDARTTWFDSLSNIAKKTDPKIFLLDSDQFNNLNNKYEAIRMKLINGTSSQDALSSANINLDNELNKNAKLDNVISGSALPQFMARAMFKCSSRDFIIVNHKGDLALITTR